jgi:hypothetical protein
MQEQGEKISLPCFLGVRCARYGEKVFAEVIE